jgi:hypothetical protein
MFTINFSQFRDASDATLSKDVDDIVLKTKGNATYTDEQPQILLAEAANGKFKIAMSNASDGGKSFRELLDAARKELLFELNVLCRLFNTKVNEDITFFLNAGFTVKKSPVRDRNPLEKPLLDYFVRDVLSGTTRGKVKNFPKGVTQLAIEYSYDGGQTWHNGTYSAGKLFKLGNLTPKMTVSVRVRFLGTFQRESDWSDAMEVFVL